MTQAPQITIPPVDLSQAEASGDPIGTYESLRQHNLSPKAFGSCSAPSTTNKGCSSYHHCRFIEYRDGLNGRVGPGNIGLHVITPNHAADGKVMACFQYYKSGLDGIRRNSDRNGWVVNIVGLEGSEVTRTGSQRMHRKRNTDCPDCTSGTCSRMEKMEWQQIVPAFPRLGEGEQTAHAGLAQRMRRDMLKTLEQEKMETALTRNTPAPPTEETPEHEGPGTVRFGRGSRSGKPNDV